MFFCWTPEAIEEVAPITTAAAVKAIVTFIVTIRFFWNLGVIYEDINRW